MRLLLLEEGHCFREQALAFCGTGPAVARDGLDGSSLSTLVQMVGAGIGVTMIPQMAQGVEARSAAVDCTPFDGPQPSRTIGLVWRKSSPLDPQLRDIAQVVKRAGQSALA
jgi:LysR family hydrogen peroxide-inducible transcriptional activator